MDFELSIHCKAEGLFSGFDEFVTTVGVAAVVSLADAGDDICDSFGISVNCRGVQKYQISSRYEGCRKLVCVFDGDFTVCEGVFFGEKIEFDCC